VIVRIQHLRGVAGLKRKPGYCIAGARAWCEANGIDWYEFSHSGVDESVLLATGDPLARRLVEHAHQVQASQDQSNE
jgi:hypothetical protein